MPTADDTPWAPSDTLLGQLQRGRGLGARRAIAATGRRPVHTARAVYDCVARDPRWDNQCEDRALYLARLVVDLALPVGPIADHLAAVGTVDWYDDLAVATLGCLARLGRDDAVPPLRRHVAEGHTWQAAFSELAGCGAAALDNLDEVLLDRADDDDLAWLVALSDEAPWPRWRTQHPRVEAAVRTQREARDRRPHRPDLGNQPRDALVAMIRQSGPGSRYAAAELSRRGDLVLLDLVEELCQGTTRPLGLVRAVRALEDAALTRSRGWLASDAPYADIGLAVIAAHGTPADAPALVMTLERALSTEDWCGVAHHAASGVARLGTRAALPSLRALWEYTPHDHLRREILPALVTLDATGSAPYVSEALWDCDGAVRQFAAARAPLTMYHRRRLARLRGEAPEEPEVRATAAHRLKS